MSPCGRNSHTIQVEPTAPVHARHWLAGPPSPRECQGGPPTLELGNVSLKKVGSQERRMKKEHADDSWEEMAALRDRRQARGLHALGCTRGPCEHCPPPAPRARGRGAQEPRVDPRPCRLWGHLRQGTPEIRQTSPHPAAPLTRHHTVVPRHRLTRRRAFGKAVSRELWCAWTPAGLAPRRPRPG